MLCILLKATVIILEQFILILITRNVFQINKTLKYHVLFLISCKCTEFKMNQDNQRSISFMWFYTEIVKIYGNVRTETYSDLLQFALGNK